VPRPTVLQGCAYRLDVSLGDLGPLDALAARQKMFLQGREFPLVLDGAQSKAL
jgi:hypothetical protein